MIQELIGAIDETTAIFEPQEIRPSTKKEPPSRDFPKIPEIKLKLLSGDCYNRPRSNSSSDVWTIFEEVAYVSNEEFTGIVRCTRCDFMTKYHGQITGTSHLRRHPCFVSTCTNADVRVAKKDISTDWKFNTSVASTRRKKLTVDKPNSLVTKSILNNNSTSNGGSDDQRLSSFHYQFQEISDALTNQVINYLSCRTCNLFVKRDEISSHLCQKDINREMANSVAVNSVIFRPKATNKATPIWKSFDELVDADTNNVLGFVRCKKCQDIFKASDPKSVPAVLRRHIVVCPISTMKSADTGGSVKRPDINVELALVSPKKRNKSSNSIQYLNSSKLENLNVEYIERCIQFCYTELVSIEKISSDSFKALVYSAHSTKSNIELPDASTLHSQKYNKYIKLRNQIKYELNKTFQCGAVGALVCDSKEDSCVLAAYYINSNWQLVECILGATTCASDINAFISQTLSYYGLDEEDKLAKFSLVSKGGVFDGVNLCQLSSTAHEIDRIINSTIFNNDKFVDIIEKCQLICTELRLDVKPGGYVDTVDWIYKFELLKKVLENIDNFELRNSVLDFRLIGCFVNDLLTPFKEASFELRNSNIHGTLNHVLLWYFKLMKVLISTQNDSKDDQSIHELKQTIHLEMEENFKLHILHKVAAFLWPNFRFLKMLEIEENRQVHKEVRKLIQTKVNENIPVDEQDEVDKYLSAMLTSCNEENILQWWKEHQKDFPKLSCLAKWIFAIPASVTLLERYKLSPSHNFDEQLLFLHCNASFQTGNYDI